MGLLDIFKKGKKGKAEQKISKRPSKGALKQPSYVKVKTPSFAKASEDKSEGKLEGKSEGKEEKSVVQEKASELASRIILSPHITEKSTGLSEKGVYVFKVASRANKVMVRGAIKEMYGTDPQKVSILNMPAKTRRSRGKIGIKQGFKKALVYLKEGEKIDVT